MSTVDESRPDLELSKLFLCHASEDEPLATKLFQCLDEKSDTFFAPISLLAISGGTAPGKIQKACGQANFIVALVTPHMLDRIDDDDGYINLEFGVAFDKGNLIPIACGVEVSEIKKRAPFVGQSQIIEMDVNNVAEACETITNALPQNPLGLSSSGEEMDDEVPTSEVDSIVSLQTRAKILEALFADHDATKSYSERFDKTLDVLDPYVRDSASIVGIDPNDREVGDLLTEIAQRGSIGSQVASNYASVETLAARMSDGSASSEDERAAFLTILNTLQVVLLTPIYGWRVIRADLPVTMIDLDLEPPEDVSGIELAPRAPWALSQRAFWPTDKKLFQPNDLVGQLVDRTRVLSNYVIEGYPMNSFYFLGRKLLVQSDADVLKEL